MQRNAGTESNLFVLVVQSRYRAVLNASRGPEQDQAANELLYAIMTETQGEGPVFEQ
jgi:hypothetical protein